MDTSKVFSSAARVKCSRPTQAGPTVQEEMRAASIAGALWLAIYNAQAPGFDDLVDDIALIHQEVNSRKRRIAERAA